MPTNYPTSLDTLTNPNGSNQLSSPSHAAQHANANDAIEAIESTLGIKYAARVRATRTTDLTVTTGTETLVPLTAEDFDTHSFHDNATNNTRLTVPAGMGGVYLIFGQVKFDSSTSGNARVVSLWKNGTAGTRLAEQSINNQGGGSLSRGMNVATIDVLVAGDYISLGVFHNVGADLAIEAAGNGIFLAMIKIA